MSHNILSDVITTANEIQEEATNETNTDNRGGRAYRPPQIRRNRMKGCRNSLGLVRILAIFLILTLGLFPPSLVHAQETTAVSVSAPSQINVGEQFIVNILVEPSTAIAGVQFDLAFAPSLVAVDRVEEGQLLSQGGAATYFNPGVIDNEAGTINGVFGAIIIPGQTVSGAGAIAIITLTAGTGAGTCPLTLSDVIVGDINGQSVPVSLVNGEVTIAVNQPPILKPIGDKTVNEGELLTFTISATDADGDSLTYSASNLPEGAHFSSSTHTFSWKPRHNQSGTYINIQFEVSDGSFADSESITITVDNVEAAPNYKANPKGPKK